MLRNFNKTGGQNRGLQTKGPRDSDRYAWTHHVVRKMQYYGLTPSRVLRVVRAPERTEEGIAPDTLAAMQTAGTKAKPWEIWVMWRSVAKGRTPASAMDLLSPDKKLIITAWRYPGVSPVRERAPIPSEIVAELEREGEGVEYVV